MIPNAASDAAEIIGRHRALAILRFLASQEANGRANDAVISRILDSMALGAPHVTLRSDIQRLEQAGFVATAETSRPGLLVVELTREGVEVAEGKAKSDLVEPPWLECPY